MNLVDDGYDGRFETAVTVLESPDHGPQLCDAVADSYPPQCSGPDLVGWDWEAVDGEESASGTTWGSYIVTGTWDGQRFTLTDTPRSDDGSLQPDRHEPDFTSPCPEPAGGWQPVDPALATDDALNRTLATASQSPDYAGAWVDQSYLELGSSPAPSEIEGTANDPARLVLNIVFTGNLADHEREIREIWGGALCLSRAEHTEAELTDIQSRLHTDFPEITSSGIDVISNVITAGTWVATTTMQAALDSRYGDGVVLLGGYLRPMD